MSSPRRLACWILSLALCGSLASAQDVGFAGPSYVGAIGSPTSSKPESKLWYADGRWWGVLWSVASRSHSIFRLDTSTQTWIDTDTAIDPRRKSRADCLWDGAKLYVASHVQTSGGGASENPLLLYRYSYLLGPRRFALDSGFPAQIGNTSTRSLVIDKDSSGVLWAVWMRDQSVWVASTVGDDRLWGAPQVLPACTSDGGPHDVCSIVHFGGERMGVLWSDEVASAFWFASHQDGDPIGMWSEREPALSGPQLSNNHLNLKTSADGRVFASVRTGLNQILMLERSTSATWFGHLVCSTGEDWTRPIVLLDESARLMHCFGTHPGPIGAIHTKSSSLDTPGFPSGIGTPVMQSALDPGLNDATSTKQNVSCESGLVVLASQLNEERYWHHYDSLGGPVAAEPVARFASERRGFAPLETQFFDASSGIPGTWSWSFGDGDSSTERNPEHAYSMPGSYDVELTVTNDLGSNTHTETQWISVLAAPNTLTLVAVEDAHVRQRSPTANYGGLTQLRVRLGPSASASSSYHAFVKFFLPDTGMQIASATLRLWVDVGAPDGGTVHAVRSTWNESLLTWQAAPPLAPPLGSFGAVTAGTWVELDVTSAALGSGLAAFGIENADTHSVFYSSREGAHPPQLVVTLEPTTQPVAAFEATPLLGSRPFTVQFFDRSRGAPTSFLWDFGDGSPPSELRNPSHPYLFQGTFAVTLTVSGPNGSDSETRTQYVHAQKPLRRRGPP